MWAKNVPPDPLFSIQTLHVFPVSSFLSAKRREERISSDWIHQHEHNNSSRSSSMVTMNDTPGPTGSTWWTIPSITCLIVVTGTVTRWHVGSEVTVLPYSCSIHVCYMLLRSDGDCELDRRFTVSRNCFVLFTSSWSESLGMTIRMRESTSFYFL